MTQTKKKKTTTGNGSRKGPTESATQFSVGTTKRGNDGNMWTILSTASGVHRWVKASRTSRTTAKKSKRVMEMEADPTTVWGKNKPLEKFWQELASGKKVVLITKKDGSRSGGGSGGSGISSRIVTMPTSPAAGKKVVLITKKDGGGGSGGSGGISSRIVTMPTSPAADKKQYIEFDEDPNIIAILSSNLSQDAYEVYLYPKAKDKSVEYVIKNYKKFFKPMGVIPNMNKVLVPA